MRVVKGQKVDITRGRNVVNLILSFGWTTKIEAMSIDAAAFILSDRNRCERDEDFIFYGNPYDRNGALAHLQSDRGDKEAIQIRLSKLPDTTTKIAFTVTIHEGEKHGYSIKDTADLYLRLLDGDMGEELFRFVYGTDLLMETAIVVGELYRYSGEWKFNAIGSGFDGGLAALCTNFGLEIEEDVSSEVAAAVEEVVLSPIDLRKKIVQYTLEKKKLEHVVARVGIVLDITGSMQTLYRNGTVQEVVERILAVACKFDDNGTLDVWVYDNEFSRLPAATEHDINEYVTNHILNNKNIHKFGRNNEPPVMADIIHKYTIEEESHIPVFIIFINDGGVVKPIKKVIIEASIQPIFWQFVGIGESDFEVLKQLDTMEGRVVDNANFIHLKDIAAVSDEFLYDQLLNEFPLWIQSNELVQINDIRIEEYESELSPQIIGTCTSRPLPTYTVEQSNCRRWEGGFPTASNQHGGGLTMPGIFTAIALFIKQLSLLVSYVKNNAFPQPLHEEEEVKHLQLMAEGNQHSRNLLIEHNLRLVAHIVKKFDNTGEDLEDLISIGTIGLIKAIESFQPNKGTKLATFAARCIENEILMHLRSLKKTRKDVSLHDPIGTDKEGNEITLIDILGTEADDIADRVQLKIEKSKIYKNLDILDDREKEVVVGRFGLIAGGEERTQREIAKELGISRSYVSRIEKRALMKLYHEFYKVKR